jgi:hypothetical protein
MAISHRASVILCATLITTPFIILLIRVLWLWARKLGFVGKSTQREEEGRDVVNEKLRSLEGDVEAGYAAHDLYPNEARGKAPKITIDTGKRLPRLPIPAHMHPSPPAHAVHSLPPVSYARGDSRRSQAVPRPVGHPGNIDSGISVNQSQLGPDRNYRALYGVHERIYPDGSRTDRLGQGKGQLR